MQTASAWAQCAMDAACMQLHGILTAHVRCRYRALHCVYAYQVLMHKQAVIVIPTGEGVYQSYANHDQQLIQAPCLKSGLPEAEPAPDQSPVNLYQIPTKTDICVVITDLCSKRNRCACASITIRLLTSASAPAHRTSDARSFFGLTNPGYAWHFTGTMVRVRVLSWPTR
jgi:hypothetical protein